MSEWHEMLRTFIYAIGPILLVIGLNYTRLQLKDQNKLRRVQALLSLNERLDRFPEAYAWINNPDIEWDKLSDLAKCQFEGYVSAFEDIGIARKLGIISREDFISSYGGRYYKLISSGTFHKYMKGSAYSLADFENLRLITKDIESRKNIVQKKIQSPTS